MPLSVLMALFTRLGVLLQFVYTIHRFRMQTAGKKNKMHTIKSASIYVLISDHWFIFCFLFTLRFYILTDLIWCEKESQVYN